MFGHKNFKDAICHGKVALKYILGQRSFFEVMASNFKLASFKSLLCSSLWFSSCFSQSIFTVSENQFENVSGFFFCSQSMILSRDLYVKNLFSTTNCFLKSFFWHFMNLLEQNNSQLLLFCYYLKHK